MVTPELIYFLFRYNLWADRRTLDACASITNEQFTRDLGSSFCSVRDTFGHLYGTDWVWNERFHGRLPSDPPNPSAFADLASTRSKLEEMDLYYLDFVSKLTEQDLDRVIHYKTMAGGEFSNTLGQCLHNLSNHGSYHRGQVVTLLRQMGLKPATTDLIVFYREQPAHASA